jgi:uncharacterized protein YkwD
VLQFNITNKYKVEHMKIIKNLLILSLTSFFIGCGTSPVAQPKNIDKLKVYTPESNQVILGAINKVRAVQRDCKDGEGLVGPSNPLVWNEALYASAYEHSQDLAYTNTFSHVGSGTKYDKTGKTLNRESYFDERIAYNGYLDYSSVGENIAAGQDDIKEVLTAWLESPAHCANLMSPVFAEVGVAIVINKESKYGIYWTQNLGDRY